LRVLQIFYVTLQKVFDKKTSPLEDEVSNDFAQRHCYLRNGWQHTPYNSIRKSFGDVETPLRQSFCC
jgi:hypothetical protein